MSGVAVFMTNPVWKFSCAVCSALLVSSEGVFQRDHAGKLLPRPEGAPTPCTSCPKPPAWAKSAGKEWEELRGLAHELTPANRKAYDHWLRCKATGQYPADKLVGWYSGAIEEAIADTRAVKEERAYRQRNVLIEQNAVVLQALTLLVKRG